MPTAVLSFKFLSLEIDFVNIFYDEGLFTTEVFLASFILDWETDDLLGLSLSFWSFSFVDVFKGDFCYTVVGFV